MIGSGVPLTLPKIDIRIAPIHMGNLLRRQIDKIGVGTKRHRLPIVTADWSGEKQVWSVGISRVGGFDRSAGFLIDTGRPGNGHIVLC